MSDDSQREETPSSGLSLGDVYHVLFRQKWIIIACSIFGVLAAAGLLAIKPPRYRSRATLLIKYVVEGRGIALPEHTALVERSLDDQEAGILNTEAQIIQSTDVAREVVDVVGADKILAATTGHTNRDEAVNQIQSNLEIRIDPSSASMITLIFQHPDPTMAQQLLGEIIKAYIQRHKEIHQPELAVKFEKETRRLTTELAATEDQLKEAKRKAGVISIEDAKRDLSTQAARIQQDLNAASVELARHQATLKELTALAQGISGKTNSESVIPADKIAEYGDIKAQIDLFKRRKTELLAMFTETNVLVVEIQQQLSQAEQKKRTLEGQYPGLLPMAAASTRTGTDAAAALDPTAEQLQLIRVTSSMEVLSNQLARVLVDAAKLDDAEPLILKLQRDRDRQEADLKYASASLEQVRREQAGSGRAPNIIPVNSTPTPAVKSWSESFIKKVRMVAVGGVFAGLGLAFFIEMFLDRSVKRRVDVERKLHMPLFISIPDMNRNGNWKEVRDAEQQRLLLRDAEDESDIKHPPSDLPPMPLDPWEPLHPLRRYYAGLRDRLITFFEVRNLAQKPKLVAVTSCGAGAGVSSIAAGLAASLSETGDGNVLLVNMNKNEGASQQFYRGKPGCGLDDALAKDTMESALVHSHLYVATENGEEGQLPQLLPKRFAALMPELKASEYDYIIFDMPAISQTTSTARLARLMDMVLLVIESEKTSQDVVKQATALLAESKANVSAVLNKTRNYVPRRLHQEFLEDI